MDLKFLFLIIGSIILMIGIIQLIKTFIYKSNSEVVNGTVKELKTDYIDNILLYFPIVEYNVDGEKFSFKSSAGYNPSRYKIGDAVEVRCIKKRNAKAYINTKFDFWGMPLMLIGFGALFTIVGLLYK